MPIQRSELTAEFPDARWRQRVRRRLLRWFDRHARDLPWRPSPGLYETWVSEIMLQQTQVATVVPYYQRFLARFPSVAALAAADEQEVLRHWEGLGYYRRARQLHTAAQQIVAHHEGRFPTEYAQVRALPGVGRYTAGAILSIALDQRHPILEANTIRLLSRLLALADDPHGRDGQLRLWTMAELMLPRRRVGDLNQALMELGSTICTAGVPACDACPLAPDCPTWAAGLQQQIPPPKTRTTYTDCHEAAVVVHCGNRLLLRYCQPGERWEGMWDFPRFPIEPVRHGAAAEQLVRGVADLTGLTITLGKQLTTIRHGVTRYRITLTCYLARSPRVNQPARHLRWVTHAEAATMPLSVTGRKIWKLLAADQNPK